MLSSRHVTLQAGTVLLGQTFLTVPEVRKIAWADTLLGGLGFQDAFANRAVRYRNDGFFRLGGFSWNDRLDHDMALTSHFSTYGTV
jgi:hypothetical protein